MILFENTGIQIIELPYVIDTNNLNYDEGLDDFFRLIRNSWTPLTLDKSLRDYARLFWRNEETKEGTKDGSKKGIKLRPILAVDTTIGEGNKGFLQSSDIGRSFTSLDSNRIYNEELNVLWESWFDKIANQKGIKQNRDVINLYVDFLKKIINDSEEIRNSRTDQNNRTEILSNGKLGGFDFNGIKQNVKPIKTNLYLDLGNTRTTGIIFEDNPAMAGGVYPYHKLKLYNYIEYFGTKDSNTNEYSDEVFSSLMEFRESPFPNYSTSETFKLLSITATGKEAFKLKTDLNNTTGRFTGLSGPKRYLWDGNPFHSNWYFSNLDGQKIQGELLKFISLNDKDDAVEDNVQTPIRAVYPRRTGIIFFLIEIFEQVVRQINSHQHRKYAQPDHPRLLSNIVISYPTAFSTSLKNRLNKQLEKATRIIRNKYQVDDEFRFCLGIDEASTVQAVFLQSNIENLTSGFPDFISSTNISSRKPITIASIDIGGGTTDLMIADYDISNFTNSNRLTGDIKHIDGVQYGGDDILKVIIDELIIDKLLGEQVGIKDTLDELFRTRDNNELRHIRINFMYLINRPLAIAYLISLYNQQVRNLIDNGKSLSSLCEQVLNRIGFKSSSNVFRKLEDELMRQIGDNAQRLLNNPIDFSKITREDVESLIQSSPLINSYLKNFAKVIDKHNTSFVLLAGKLSEIPIISDRMRLYLPTSPDRVVNMSDYITGEWYPFNKDGKITDPKTSVSIGLSISDLSKNSVHARGLSVNINENQALSDQSYYLVSHSNATLNLNPNERILKSGEKESIPININENKKSIYASREIGFDTNYGNPLYEIVLKEMIEIVVEDPPSLTLVNKSGELEINEDSLSGKVKDDDQVRDLELNDVKFQLKTITEGNYYLDTGLI
jgi:hypothetical protein